MFDLDALQKDAIAQAGSRDFGDDDHIEPLRLMLRSLIEDAGMHEAGAAMMRERVVKLLVNRLRIEEHFQKHPEIERERIHAPLIIASLPRTGTTMLHRFIANDPDLAAVLWYEARNPAPLAYGDAPGDADPRVAQAEAEVRLMLETYPGLDAIHPMSAVEPDEDIMLMEHVFCCGMAIAMANVTRYDEWEREADHTFAYEYLHRILKFLQWQKKRAGQPCKRWVLKAPEHLRNTHILTRIFPDATIILGHRDPRQTIPSISSMIYSGWAAYADDPDKHLIGDIWGRRLSVATRCCMETRETLAENQVIDLWYKDLIKEPMDVVKDIYERVGMRLGDDAQERMAAWRESNRRELRQKHEYSLQEYGFDEARIDELFGEYRERFVLNRDG